MERRRLFLGVAASLAVAASARVAAETRDDAPRLQAKLDAGLPIVGGDYVLRRPLTMRNGSLISHASFRLKGGINLFVPPGPHVGRALISHCTVVSV